MATGIIQAAVLHVRSKDCDMGFAKRVDFVKTLNVMRVKSSRTKFLVIKSSNQVPDIAELQPASEGSSLLLPRQKYCESPYKTIRRKTCTVMVGNVAIGSDHPIRIQTMTTTDTKDIAATVEQVMRIADSGADIVRITVQGKREADACFEIKNTLVQKNYNIPLVADIHFAPSVAVRVAECFEKIRVNPGNFADRRAQFEQLEYTEEDYQKELEHIEQVFAPLVEKCKKYGRAMRIGTNHGSLSDRIMSYYGDSPRGMVESAFEFARICRKLDYHNFVFSMKASNPVVMVEAYRLLVAEMYLQGWDYPLHLGVTEAGEGEDGRMKSAIGIGTLLQDGLGDTIRVSLTEPPEEEIDPCRRLANLGARAAELQQGVAPFEEKHRHYFEFQRRSGQLPAQREGGRSGLQSVSYTGWFCFHDRLNFLYTSLAQTCVGMPFKIQYYSGSFPTAASSQEANVSISMGVIGPFSEQLTSLAQCNSSWVNLKELMNWGIQAFTRRDDLVHSGWGHMLEALLVDGLGDGTTSFNLLRAAKRNTKTDTYHAHPCGRTLFDLQETVVKRGIAMEQATDALIDLIKEHGRWVDPPAEE
ncbi:hypothetical protein Cgig2_028331 [Carnegiea gigantea]|uniref:IspG TIM-barrel domain-containing protein n=1 Tax=Carnegiea gigantea TaxID=171969 RepID=A0A9Q1KKK7_9CARY|nr:hypothetical protein Cgig2_028331 [Carnegiea gigantea]